MTETPEIGDLVLDTVRNRVGEVMATVGGRLLLRPPGGGREWEAAPSHVRPATSGEALRSKVAEANERSRQGRGQPEAKAAEPGRCEGCWDIKRRRYRALEAGEKGEAARMTQAMGVHLRAAH